VQGRFNCALQIGLATVSLPRGEHGDIGYFVIGFDDAAFELAAITGMRVLVLL